MADLGQEIVHLDAGVPITTWPYGTGGGGEINIRVDPPFVPHESGEYLVTFEPDPMAGGRRLSGHFTFRRIHRGP